MKLTVAGLVGASIVWAAAAICRPTIRWALTRIPPATPEGWTPKHRTWTNGIENT